MTTTLSLLFPDRARAPHARFFTFATAALLGIGFAGAQAQTTLSVGDLSFIAAEADSNGAVADGYTIVSWVTLAAGTVIKFTDNGMANAAATAANTSEHAWTFTVGASAISAGTTLNFGYNSPTTGRWNGPGSGTTSGNLTPFTNAGISTSGDQLFAYQGSGTGANLTQTPANAGAFSGTLVSGINFGPTVTSGPLTAGNQSNETYAPTALVNGNAYVNGGNFDNGYYNGVRSGLTNNLYRAATTNVSNFTFTDTLNAGYDRTASFTIASSASIHWDADGTGTGNGGGGTWDNTTSNRFKDSAAGTTFFRWVGSSTGNDHSPVFAGTAGTVSVGAGGVTASGLQFDVSGYTVQSNTITLSGSTTPVLTVATGSHTAAISSTLAGTGGFTKSGAGALTLSGNNDISGNVAVNGGTLTATATGSDQALGAATSLNLTGGTLLLGSSDQINNSAGLTLAGGAFATGGNSETLSTLTLSSNSTIQLTLADNTQDIRFSDYVRSGGLLTINDWTGAAGTSGTAGRLLFATSSTFDATEFGNIQFTGFGLGAQLISSNIGGFNELVPVPEPSGVFVALGLFGLAAWREGRRSHVRRRTSRFSSSVVSCS